MAWLGKTTEALVTKLKVRLSLLQSGKRRCPRCGGRSLINRYAIILRVSSMALRLSTKDCLIPSDHRHSSNDVITEKIQYGHAVSQDVKLNTKVHNARWACLPLRGNGHSCPEPAGRPAGRQDIALRCGKTVLDLEKCVAAKPR